MWNISQGKPRGQVTWLLPVWRPWGSHCPYLGLSLHVAMQGGQANSGRSPVQAPADRVAGDRSLSLTLQNFHGDKNWYMENIYCGAGKTHPFLGAACLLDPRVSSNPSAGGLSSQTLSFTAVTAVCNYTRT